MNVKFGTEFALHFLNFPRADKQKINDFINHVTEFGLEGLAGRNKSSDNVPFDDPNWAKKVNYAQTHKLWHYHIGIPTYEQATNGEWVSEYILHYQRFDDTIILVEMSYHPPFSLPNEKYLVSKTDE